MLDRFGEMQGLQNSKWKGLAYKTRSMHLCSSIFREQYGTGLQVRVQHWRVELMHVLDAVC